MIQTVLKKIFGSRNERLLKQYQRQVRATNALEPAMEKLSDGALRLKTAEFRNRIMERLARIPEAAAGDAVGARALGQQRVAARREVLDDLLPEAVAVVREAGMPGVNMGHFDV